MTMGTFSAYDFTDIPRLNEEQSKSPFAKFYYEPVNKPAPEVLAAIGETQLDPALALPFSEMEKIFLPDGASCKNGWCMLPDGTGFSSIITKMPDVTPEMEQWWGGWFAAPDYDYVNYRTWLPGLHRSHEMPITENLGWGFVNISMAQPVMPSMLNLSAAPEQLDPNFIDFKGSSGYSRPDGQPEAEPYYIAIFNCIKHMGRGLQVHTVAYSGMGWRDGTLVKFHDADPDRVRLFAMHNAYEFGRKAVLLPKLYEYAKTL